MILLDFSQVSISAITGDPKNLSGGSVDKELLKHIVINTIRDINLTFRKEYGELVICCDSKSKYWRKMLFKHYKANRKKTKEKSSIDWNAVDAIVDEVKKDLIENFPYCVVEARAAEGDDVIAVLTEHITQNNISEDGLFEEPEKILIVSADEDFLSLQKFRNVYQYARRSKKWLTCQDPTVFIKEKVLTGDSGDGIPSFINPDDCFVNGVRQKPLYKTRIDEMIQNHPNLLDGCTTIQEKERLKMNMRLIDFSYIPDLVKEEILNVWESENKRKKPSAMHLLSYFSANRMNILAGCSDDFKVNRIFVK